MSELHGELHNVPLTSAAVKHENDDKDSKPQHVSQQMWQKFQDLKKRKEEITRKADEKQRERIKTNRKRKIQLETQQTDSKKGKQVIVTNTVPAATTSSTSTEQGFERYIGCNDHLKGVDHDRNVPKTKLEEKINTAISLGDYNRAEELSDHLVKRQVGYRINEAIQAKHFDEENKEKDKILKAKKEKKLYWGFQPKQRWETKGNM